MSLACIYGSQPRKNLYDHLLRLKASRNEVRSRLRKRESDTDRSELHDLNEQIDRAERQLQEFT